MAIVSITLARFGGAGDSFGLQVDDTTGLISGAIFTVNDGRPLTATATDTATGQSFSHTATTSEIIPVPAALGLLWTPRAPIRLKDRTDTIALSFSWG
ncbi:MAG: hypothetical protein NVS2B16_25620 [Chloroflexota bacterium]